MVELVLRVVLSLGIVLGLMWFVARASSRKLGGRSRSVVAVVARQPLSRGSSLAVVEVGERVLVVDMGWPSDDRAYADIATFGASRLVGRALLELLGERS